jgi:hypothetical protein
MAVLVVLLLVDAVVVAWNTAKNRVVYWPTRILRGTTLVFVDILCACRPPPAPAHAPRALHLQHGIVATVLPHSHSHRGAFLLPAALQLGPL